MARTTDQQLQEAVNALARHGTKAAAAKAMGIPVTTLRDRCSAAERRGITGEVIVQRQVKGQPAEIKKRDQRIAELERRLEQIKNTRYDLKPSKPVIRKGAYVRLIVPDTHGCKADAQAMGAFLSDAESLNPSEIILLGDHLDCGGFLAQHHTLSYVSETSYTFEEDCDATNVFLDKMQALKAPIHYLEGNHERRLEKWCVTQALANEQNANYLRKHFSTTSVLHLEQRGIHFYEQGKFYHGLGIPATIKLGHCHFTHGSRTGVNAARAMLTDFAGNVVFGHTHRIDNATTRKVSDGVVGAWSPGCLCKLQPLWQHTQITGWAHGYGVQLVNEDGSFLHINVPIIDGKSYLIALTNRLI